MKTPLLRISVGVVVVLVALVAKATTLPPATPFGDFSWEAKSKSRPSTGLRMGSFNIHFEQTTLAMVQSAVGYGEIAHKGDAAESMYWLCYAVRKPQFNERVWIIAHGEMGGREHAVTSVIAQKMTSDEVASDCPILPSSLQPLSLDNGLWLGARKSKAVDLLGPPSHRSGPWWVFDYSGFVPGNCEPDGFISLNWLMFEVKDEHLIQIGAGQVTSC